MSQCVSIDAANSSLNVATEVWNSTNSYTTLVTENNIIDHAHALVMKGLQEMNSDDLAKILCEKLISSEEELQNYKTLSKIYKKNYIQILKILLRD